MADVLLIDPRAPEPEPIRRAVEALASGALVVFPTETVYGLAVDPRVEGAEERVYAAKGRDPNKPLAYMLADPAQLAAFGVAPNGLAQRLANAFWPGPLTLVLEAGGRSIGFRVPDHAVALAVLRAAGGPLLVTSANRSGAPAACTAAEAVAQVGSAVAVVLDGGPAPGGVASTVVKVDHDDMKILRHGALTEDQLRAVS